MEERHELTRKIFGYCLVIAVIIWGFASLFSPLIAPDALSEKDQKKYQKIATEYYETGEYECEENIVVIRNSGNEINIADSSRPFSESLTFRFSDEGVTVEPGINLNFLKIIIPLLMLSIAVMMVVAVIVWLISLFLFP